MKLQHYLTSCHMSTLTNECSILNEASTRSRKLSIRSHSMNESDLSLIQQ